MRDCKITCGIPTKGRYDGLDSTLLSIALQTRVPDEIIIVDDTDSPVDLTTVEKYNYIFRLFDDKGIKWKVIFGEKKGQHFSHELIQNIAEGDYIFRIDDDCVAEPDTIRRLVGVCKGDIVAVAPSVMMPNPKELPKELRNRITSMQSPNVQWFKGTGLTDADHLYSCFLYKKGLVHYDLRLSTIAHREETIFTYSLKRLGYKLMVNSDAKVWHFRNNTGGIRSFHNTKLWEDDEKIFEGYLNLWGVRSNKVIVINGGIGDHYALKHIVPDLKKKYQDLTIACAYPEVFEDDEVKLISIAEAELMFGNLDTFNVYKFMAENNWKESIVEAFKQMYL